MSDPIQVLNTRQVNALRWVKEGCPTWPGPPGSTMKALVDRNLVKDESGPRKPPFLMTRAGERALTHYYQQKKVA